MLSAESAEEDEDTEKREREKLHLYSSAYASALSAPRRLRLFLNYSGGFGTIPGGAMVFANQGGSVPPKAEYPEPEIRGDSA